MLRKTDQFLSEMLDALAKVLPGQWQRVAGPAWRMLRAEDWGYSGVGPLMSFKHLPATQLFLSYGIKHTALESTLNQFDLAAGYPILEAYQFDQTTQNYPLEPGRKSILIRDYNQVDFDAAIQTLLGQQGLERLFGLFARFSDLREIRRALEDKDGTLLTYGLPKRMVAIDLALDDLDHLRRFRENCKPRHFAGMIDKALTVLGVTL